MNVFVEEQLKYSRQLDTDQQKSQRLLLGLKPRYLRFFISLMSQVTLLPFVITASPSQSSGPLSPVTCLTASNLGDVTVQNKNLFGRYRMCMLLRLEDEFLSIGPVFFVSLHKWAQVIPIETYHQHRLPGGLVCCCLL